MSLYRTLPMVEFYPILLDRKHQNSPSFGSWMGDGDPSQPLFFSNYYEDIYIAAREFSHHMGLTETISIDPKSNEKTISALILSW